MSILHEMPVVHVASLGIKSYIRAAFFCEPCRKEHIGWAIKAIDDYINEDG